MDSMLPRVSQILDQVVPNNSGYFNSFCWDD